MIHGIQTIYKDRLYRSRLEARWAAFFDLVGWMFEYEPYEFNGWIPDFIIIGKRDAVLVEVKPFTHFEEFDTGKILNAMGNVRKEVLLLGLCIWPETDIETASVGWLGEQEYWTDEGGCAWASALFSTLGGLGFAHADWSFHNRITGEQDGHIAPPTGAEWEEIMRKWNEAANIVQWFPRNQANEKRA